MLPTGDPVAAGEYRLFATALAAAMVLAGIGVLLVLARRFPARTTRSGATGDLVHARE